MVVMEGMVSPVLAEAGVLYLASMTFFLLVVTVMVVEVMMRKGLVVVVVVPPGLSIVSNPRYPGVH